jgi:pyruvate formate lyase activating enzyme
MVLRIERASIHDGPGIRTTVFLKGCPLRCLWCHAPESQSLEPEPMPRPERCLLCLACLSACEHGALAGHDGRIETDRAACEACGRCVEVCPSGAREIAGRTMTVGDVIDEVRRDRIFYEESGGGVTFSGGEPLMQPGFLFAMLRRCRAERIHAAVDTSGWAEAATVRAAGRLADLILFDLKLMDSDRHRRFTGAPNERILGNLALLAAEGRPVIVRLPLIPGVNDDEGNIRATGAFVASLGLGRVDLLPYHRAGTAKYERLARPYALAGVDPPAPEDVTQAIRWLEAHGLQARPGGSS